MPSTSGGNTLIRPVAMQIEASSSCQLRCPACPTATGATRPVLGRGFLRADDLARLLDANPAIRQVELSNYGEMFLNPELADLLRVCHERGVAASGNNGANLNRARPDALEAVVRYRMRVLTVSIDGASQETYAQYRVGGDFNAAIANIERINEHKRALAIDFPKLRWQFVVFGHNEHEIAAARAKAATLGMVFVPKLSWDDTMFPVRDAEAVRRAMPEAAASRAEYRARTGREYLGGICHQLWDSPQVNWDGKMLGCCRNFWGDFGGNVLADGFLPAVNSERMAHARAMVLGRAAPRDNVPCTTCDLYIRMRESGQFLNRDDIARGQTVSVSEAIALAARWREDGRIADARAVCRRVLSAEPLHAGALRLLYELQVGPA